MNIHICRAQGRPEKNEHCTERRKNTQPLLIGRSSPAPDSSPATSSHSYHPHPAYPPHHHHYQNTGKTPRIPTNPYQRHPNTLNSNKTIPNPPKMPPKSRNPTLFSRSCCTPRVRVGVTSSKGPLIYPSSATFCAHFGPCVGDLHPPHFARIFEPDHRPPHFRRKFKPMRAPGEAAANSPTGGGVRAVRCDSHVSDAMGEMTSCGRRSVGPGR